MKLSLVAPLTIAASAAIGLAPITSADVSVQQSPGNPQVTATPGAARNRQPNSSSHSAEMWTLCCSTTDLVHSAVLNRAVGLAISAADLGGRAHYIYSAARRTSSR